MDNNPLVSVLIATHNRPQYFELSLISALSQSYANIEIIICDDSTDYRTKNIVEKYMKVYKNIKYFFNGGQLGERGLINMHKCYSLANGEFINYLNDDDIFDRYKIEKMIQCFYIYENIKLVTSHRGIIDKNGNLLADIDVTKPIANMNQPIAGLHAIGKLILQGNFIGEPTTVLFRKRDVSKFGLLNGRQFYALVDIATWISLLLTGNFVYMSDTLSYFRIHESQNTMSQEIRIKILLESLILVDYGYSISVVPADFYSRFYSEWTLLVKPLIPIITSIECFKQYWPLLKKLKMI
ncbi:glycosyltransferase family 2 protein [Clostridium guangxiense]|uniref:glycosyltransferase family 2 protein n=1 Tax=Clostridium guangxiense TaxID=1662055 RepID=UPI001E53E275|nr:glycosyltransferase [Clostridium guangxiense]MCD2345383.1 glycosyltransferase [Clostridium guangxiense]